MRAWLRRRGRVRRHAMTDELNGRMMVCEIFVTGFKIAGMDNTDRIRKIAQAKVDELFSLMKLPSAD